MKKFFWLAAFAAVSAFASCDNSEDPQTEGQTGITIRAMSYNVRYATVNDGNNAWDNRKHGTIAMLGFIRPDVFGVQEALQSQVKYISQEAPVYQNVGVGRDDGKTKGEFMSIFWNTETMEMLEWGTYWLSETPDTPSLGWDAACKRAANDSYR